MRTSALIIVATLPMVAATDSEELSMLQIDARGRAAGDMPPEIRPGDYLGSAKEPCVRPLPMEVRPHCHPANDRICSPKRGLLLPLTHKQTVCKFLKLFQQTRPWWMNGESNICPLCPSAGSDYSAMCEFNYDSGFVPIMTHLAQLQTPLSLGEAVLGFNEPNHGGHSHGELTPQEAFDNWKFVEKKASDMDPSILQIGSPVTFGSTRDTWWNDFFTLCAPDGGRSSGNPKKCKIDFLQAHIYKTKALGQNSLQSELEALHHMYGLPIWLTEFNSGGSQHKDTVNEDHQFAYMKEALPLLESLTYVQKYAWFSACHEPNHYRATPASALVTDCDKPQPQLTNLGVYYHFYKPEPGAEPVKLPSVNMTLD